METPDQSSKSHSPEQKRESHFFSSHHGEIHDVAEAIKDDDSSLKMLIDMLPKRARELEEISQGSDDSERMFFNMIKQSFRYLQTIIDLQNTKPEDIGSEEFQKKDETRKRCHDAIIGDINAWSRSLAKNGIDNSFMVGILATPPVRAIYGTFAIGLVTDIYTDEDFDIDKYIA